MPKGSKIDTELTDALRDELNDKLINNRFSDYKGLEAWLAEQGFSISHAAIHRHGQGLKERLQRNIANATQATLILKECPDYNDGLMISATLALIQSEMFGLMNAVQTMSEDESNPEKHAKLLKDLTTSIVNIGKATNTQHKLEQEVRKQERERAATIIDNSTKVLGINKERRDIIRRDVLGMSDG